MTDSLSVLTDLWRFGATILILAMQAGFLLLEAGSVRGKNSVNVAQKNVTDLIICWVVFLCVGFTIGFGLPSPLWQVEQTTPIISFLFQLGFCSAAATIVAGAVAERMRFSAYALLTICMVAVIYPVSAWAVWGNALIETRSAWLANLGFVDFAGATVVHGLSAAVALAAIIRLGPRDGLFSQDGTITRIPGHSPVFAMLGLTILLIGWFGFNAGALDPSEPLFRQTILNTATAACFGGLAALLAGRWFDRGIFAPSRTINGILGGLVTITASGGYPTTLQAAGLGAAGGLLAILGADWVLRRLRLDDPLDVVAVHGFCGIFGTLMVAAVLPTDQLVHGSRISQLGVQGLGLLSIMSACFGVAWLFLKGIDSTVGLRVSEEDEYLGLNHTEHGVSIDAQRLKRALDSKLVSASYEGSVSLDQHVMDEAGELAQSLNALLERHDQARATISKQAQRFEHFASTTTDYLWETDVELKLVHLSSGSEEQLSEISDCNESIMLFDIFKCATRDEAENLRRIKKQGPLTQFTARMQLDKSGNIRTLDVAGVPYFDDYGNLLGYRGGATDTTELRLAEQRAKHLAFHDELTGLGNRRALNQSLTEALARVNKEDDSIVIAGIDLDGFKDINDAYGHAVGDQLLAGVATRLLKTLREQDHLYRTGGDEFIAVLGGFSKETRRDDAVAWCSRMVDTLSHPFQLEQQLVGIEREHRVELFPGRYKRERRFVAHGGHCDVSSEG